MKTIKSPAGLLLSLIHHNQNKPQEVLNARQGLNSFCLI